MIKQTLLACLLSATIATGIPERTYTPLEEFKQSPRQSETIAYKLTQDKLLLGMLAPPIGIPAGLPSSLIDSIQIITVPIASSATSGTTTISSVDTARSFVVSGGWTHPSNGAFNASNACARHELTNSTTVTAYRDSSSSDAITVYCTVVQLKSAFVVRIQQGTITLTAASSNTATITSVATANSILLYNGATCSSTSNRMDIWACSVSETSSTVITAQRGTTTGNCTVGYTRIELISGVITLNQKSAVVCSSSATGTTTITSTTTARTALFHCGWYSASASLTNGLSPWITLTNSTTVTATHSGTSGDNQTTSFCAIEFAARYINSVQMGSDTIANSTSSKNTAISSVNTSLTVPVYMGQTNNVLTPGTVLGACSLTGATTSTVYRGFAYASGPMIVGYQQVEFK